MRRNFFIIMFLVVFNIGAVYSKPETKAFSNINFEDSVQTVTNKIKESEFLDTSGLQFSDMLSGTFHFSMVDGEYWHHIRFYFYTDMLYRVEIESPSQLASSFNGITVPFRDNLVDLISVQYGPPSTFIPRDYSDLKLGYTVWSHIWDKRDIKEDKEIKIGYADSSYSYKNSARLVIEYLPLAAQKKAEEEKIKSELIDSQSGLF